MDDHKAILAERAQANFWKLKCLEYINEVRKSNKAIGKLQRRLYYIRTLYNTRWNTIKEHDKQVKRLKKTMD